MGSSVGMATNDSWENHGNSENHGVCHRTIGALLQLSALCICKTVEQVRGRKQNISWKMHI